ncbi:hypothetical protein BN946_scf184789.g5 [Trametes cinnabarina]|uniref:Uncharacterized protein n=1 Tax=Pycnoporus cinnabarinus TaxID=5643 RepID=A0A060T153_PYCCI|nr:hypothetical protein BN946_scf184789.g5 [Trametes cinnabarina]
MQYPLASPAPCHFHSPAPEGLAGLISSNESSDDPLSESLLNIEDQEPSLEDIESGSSGDEYQPQNQDAEGESKMDDDSEAEDSTDVRPAQGKKNVKQTKPHRADVKAVKVVASQKASSARDWEQVLEDNNTGLSMAAVQTSQKNGQQCAASVSSAASTAPVSSSANSVAGDSSNADDLFLTTYTEFTDDNGNSQPPLPPSPPRSSRYHIRDSSAKMTTEISSDIGPTPPSRKIAAIEVSLPTDCFPRTLLSSALQCKDILTKVITCTSAPDTQKLPTSTAKTTSYPPTLTSTTARAGINISLTQALAPGHAGQEQGTATTGNGKTPKSKVSDLPAVLCKPFNTWFVPLIRQYLRVKPPWVEITLVATFQEIIEDARNASLEGDSEEADPLAESAFSTPDQVGIYAEWLLGNVKKKAPFYWKRWNGSDKPEVHFHSLYDMYKWVPKKTTDV